MQLPAEGHIPNGSENYQNIDGTQDSDRKSPIIKAVPDSPHSPPTFAHRFWQWTGFTEKTLFDWLQIISSIAVPIILGLLSYQWDNRQAINAENNQRAELITKYYERMQVLLIDKNMRSNPMALEARSMGRATTLSTFRQLDGERKGELLKFLFEAQLISPQCQDSTPNCLPVLDLSGARLERMEFQVDQFVRLPGADLERVSLEDASLPKIQLSGAKINRGNLRRANITGALLQDAQMEGSILTNTQLAEAVLRRANLKSATLVGANLERADLRQAALDNADLTGANLKGADLTDASLQGTKLSGAIYDSETKLPGFNPSNRGMVQQ